MNEQALRRKALQLIRTGKMPTIEQWCAAVLDSRMKFATKIRRARREAREQAVRRG